MVLKIKYIISTGVEKILEEFDDGGNNASIISSGESVKKPDSASGSSKDNRPPSQGSTIQVSNFLNINISANPEQPISLNPA